VQEKPYEEPLWCPETTKNNHRKPASRNEFLHSLKILPARKGVPDSFTASLIADKDAFRMLVKYAGALEHRNASFVEQQVAVADRVVKVWERFGHDGVAEILANARGKRARVLPRFRGQLS
jgi:hypothetical protein